MTPLIVTYPDGSLYATIGASGGSRIISAVAQCLWRSVEHGGTMTEALRHGRLHDQVSPNELLLEREWFPFVDATAEEMRKKGHEIRFVQPGLSSVQAIRRLDDGVFEAVGEPRQVNSGGFTV
jgi:gamma-glutamyltranspeptidase/glutathione hydrolase